MSLHDAPALPISSAEELKSRLASQLDEIGNIHQDSVDDVLWDILQDIAQSWADAEDPLPHALVYPVKRDPTRVGRDPENFPKIDADMEAEEFSGYSLLWEIEGHAGFDPSSPNAEILDERGQAVCRALKEVPGLEIFLIRYDQARHDHDHEGMDYFDILGRPRLVNFNMPFLDTLSSSHGDSDMAVVLCQSELFVGDLFEVIYEDEREPLRDQAMSYLIHYAAEHPSEDVLDELDEAIKYGPGHVSTHAVNKLLVCSIFLKDWRMFYTAAHSYASEPSLEIFSILNRALVSYSMLLEDFEQGFEELLKKLFTSERLPDALLAMETPEHVKSNPDGFIATFIDSHFDAIERGIVPGAGFQEAGAVIRICALYQDGFDRAKQLDTMFAARVDNGRFCLGLVLHIFKHLHDGSISPSTARSWYQCFRHHGLAQMHLCDVIGITEFSKDEKDEGKSSRTIGDNTRNIPDGKPMQRSEAGSMFTYMVQLGWYKEAVEFLTEFVLRKLRLDDLGFNCDIFESLWLPFFADIFDAYRGPDDGNETFERNWRQINPILRDTFLAVVIVYAVCVVGREPGKGSLRRARLSSRCGCVSCQAINTFLSDETKARQLFLVTHKKNSATRQLSRQWEAGYSTITVSRRALGHIVRQLDDAERDCAYHIRETKAAGLVLFLQKQDNARQWRAWNDRREVAKEKMRQLGLLKEILGKQHVVWESLAFLEEASPSELMIPFIMDNAKAEAKTLTGIRQMLREQLGLLRGVRGLTWKTITVSPEGLTIIWL